MRQQTHDLRLIDLQRRFAFAWLAPAGLLAAAFIYSSGATVACAIGLAAALSLSGSV